MESDLNIEDALIVYLFQAKIEKQANSYKRLLQHIRIRLLGHDYIVKLLNSGYSRCIRLILRIELVTFY